MKMTIERTTQEDASTEIPHELFVRFLKSLGYPVTSETQLHVYQPGVGKTGQDLIVRWKHSVKQDQKEIEVIEDDVVNIVAGMNDA